jgi:diguanylate cyclase (GGDEF)-like protein
MANWSITPFPVLQGLISIFTLCLAIIVWQRRGIPGSKQLSFMLLAVTIWTSMTGLDTASIPISQKIIWSKIQYLGISSCPVFFLLFIIEYTNQEHFLNRTRLALLWLIPVTTVAMAATNEIHHLIWTSFTPIPGSNLIVYGHGSWFWLYAIYAYILIVLTIFLLIRALIRYPSYYRQQSFLLAIATFFPWLGNFIYIANLAPGLDLTPTGFAITGLFLTWAIYRQGLFDLAPVAREHVLESMEDGLIVLDSRNRIVDLNMASERILAQVFKPGERPSSKWVGQNVSHIVAGWTELQPYFPFLKDARHEILLETPHGRQFFDLHVSMMDRLVGKRTGKLLLLHEITHLKHVQQEALRAREVAEMLYATGNALSTAPSFAQSLEQVFDHIRQVVACDGGAFALGENGSLQLSALRGLSLPADQPPPVFQTPYTSDPSPDDLRQVEKIITEGLLALDAGIQACLAAPIIYQASLSGMLVLFRRSSNPFTYEEEHIAASLATQVSITLANVRLVEQLQIMAATDSLTGLNNRRHFFDLATHLFDHSIRYRETFSIILFDLDNFKQINDTYGHIAGDEVLRALSAICRHLVRKVDVIARYGGEEFVIALPMAGLDQAAMIAERLREEIEQTSFAYHNQSIRLTISLGVAAYLGIEDTLESVLERADQALYLAKQTGRNCVQTYLPPS